MFNITWCTHSTGVLSCEVLIVIKAGLIQKKISKGLKSHLNLDPLSNTTLRVCGYLLSYVLLNNWLTLANDLSIYSELPHVISSRSNVSTLTILNQHVSALIIVMKLRLTILLMIAPPGWCCIIDLLYGIIRPTCKVSHSFSSVMFLDGRRP